MKPYLLNFAWFLVACGAFLGGTYWQQGGPLRSWEMRLATSQKGAPLQGLEARAASRTSTHADPESGMKGGPLASVADFMSRFGLDKSEGLSSDRMRDAIVEVLRESDPVKSGMMFSMLLQQLTSENAPVVAEELRNRAAGFDGLRYLGLLTYQWGTVDGPGALDAAKKQGGPGAAFGRMAALSGWSSEDPKGAAQWLAANKSENEWENSLMQRGLIGGMARTDVNSAVEFASKLNTKEERKTMGETIANEKLKEGLEGASDWAVALTDPELRAGAFAAVAEQQSRIDATKAAEWIKAYAGDDFALKSVGDVAERLAREDPQSGVKFAGDLPQGKARTTAYTNTFKQWAEKDSIAASTALTTMPAGADRDAGVSGLAREIAADNPMDAITWAQSIQDPVQQTETMESVLARYYSKDATGAENWMAENNISAEQQEKIRTSASGGGRGFRGFGPPR